MKDKVLLLNPPANIKYIRDFYCSFSSKTNYYWPPQDLLVLSGILRQNYEVEVLDAVGTNLKEDICFNKIMECSAIAVVFTTGTASFGKDIRFVERIKKNKNIKIIGSSSIFRFIGKDTMERFPFLDALIFDFVNHDIIDYLKDNYAKCEYIIHKRGNNIYLPRKEKEGDFSVGIAMQKLFINHSNRIPIFGDSPFSIVVGSIGCNFKCKFCVAGTMKLRIRVLREVIEELQYIFSLGIKKVFFVDPLFTADKNRVLEFCAGLKKNNIKIGWACNAHPITLQDNNLLRIMKEAGCQVLMIGVESANEDILKTYNKGTTIGQIKTAFELCRKSKIKTLAYFIIGLPGEDDKMVKMTIKLAKEIKCDYASFSYATPEIGTELREESLARNWIIDPTLNGEFDSSTTPILRTNQLSEEKAQKLLHAAYKQFYIRPSYIIKKFLEIRSLGDVKLLLKQGCLLIKKNIL